MICASERVSANVIHPVSTYVYVPMCCWSPLTVAVPLDRPPARTTKLWITSGSQDAASDLVRHGAPTAPTVAPTMTAGAPAGGGAMTTGQPAAWPSSAGHSTDPGPTDPGPTGPRSGWGAEPDGPRVPIPGQRGPERPPAGPPPPEPRRIRRRGTLLGLHSGQLVTAELALIVLLASAAGGAARVAVAAPVAAILLVVAFGRIRRMWAYQWLALGSRFVGRRRVLPRG